MNTIEGFKHTLTTSQDQDAIVGTLVDLGKYEYIPELAPTIARFLQHQDAELRERAIATLALHWQLPAYCSVAHEMAQQDEDASVRALALSAWAFYFQKSDNTIVLRELISILKNETEDPHMRGLAYSLLFTVGTTPPSNPADAKHAATGYASGLFDWELVEKIAASIKL